jgi:hypothetical protein
MSIVLFVNVCCVDNVAYAEALDISSLLDNAVVTVPAKFASSLSACASSLRVSKVPGAESTKYVTAAAEALDKS